MGGAIVDLVYLVIHAKRGAKARNEKDVANARWAEANEKSAGDPGRTSPGNPCSNYFSAYQNILARPLVFASTLPSKHLQFGSILHRETRGKKARNVCRTPLSPRRPCIVMHARFIFHDGGTIVQVAASQLTSSKVCSKSNPMADNPSWLPSPSICAHVSVMPILVQAISPLLT